MYGRRYNNGLHQAIEAKEHVKINDESKTLATITFQNYFRMYEKLSGMTGTAMTEEAEFQEIYKLDVVEIPTNKPMIRKDNSDIIYKNEDAKFRAVIADIKKAHQKGHRFPRQHSDGNGDGAAVFLCGTAEKPKGKAGF